MNGLIQKTVKKETHINTHIFFGYAFPNKLRLDEGITSWDLNIGFLVKNNPYGLIPRPKLANPGQNIRKFIS